MSCRWVGGKGDKDSERGIGNGNNTNNEEKRRVGGM